MEFLLLISAAFIISLAHAVSPFKASEPDVPYKGEADSAPNFNLIASAPGTRYDGQAVAIRLQTGSPDVGYHPNFLTSNMTKAAVFTLGKNAPKSNLINFSNGLSARQLLGPHYYRVVYFPTRQAISVKRNFRGIPICVINPDDQEFLCTSQSDRDNPYYAQKFYGCHGDGFNLGWAIFPVAETRGRGIEDCSPIQLFAVSV